MTALLDRSARRIAPLLLALGLVLSPGRRPRPPEPRRRPRRRRREERAGPLDGYLGTGSV